MSVPAVKRERSIGGSIRWGTCLAVVLVGVAAACHVPDGWEGRAVFRLRPSKGVEARRRVVDIEGMARPSWVTALGAPLTLDAEAPEGAELRFACTVDPEPTRPVTFRAWAGGVTAERRLLWEWTFDPADSTGPTWHEAAIPLGSSAGGAVRLQLETHTAEDDGGARWAAWAVPRLVAPVTGDSRPNIVLVIIDTLRADHMSLYGYQRQTTPGIDAWARRRGVVFKSVVAQAPWTLPSHVSLFTGLDALSHGLNHKETIPETITTLAERLAEAGYLTKAITGGAYLGPGTGLMQGFDSLDHWFLGDSVREQRANDIVHNTQLALRWLSECDERPFFLLFHTYEVHAPYRAREPFFSRFRGGVAYPAEFKTSVSLVPPDPASGFQEHFQFTQVFQRTDGTPVFRAVGESDLAVVRDSYDAGVAFADTHIARLLERLTVTGLEDHTAVILTSDHGESLGESGLAGHGSLSPAELLVPLVVVLPDGAHRGPTVDTQVRLVDVLPTVLELAGVAAPPGLDGTSLLPLITDRTSAFPEEAWSYAASSNYGVALRIADRFQYTFNDSALSPLHGMEDFELLAPQSQPEAKRGYLRQRVRSALERRLGGLRVELRSRGLQPLQCTLRGRLVEPNRVKAVELPADSVRWTEGALEITVDAGESLVLSLQGRLVGRLMLNARAGTAALEHTLEPGHLKGVWQATAAGARWEVGAAEDDEARTAIRVWIHRPPPDNGTSPADFDDQTLEQLRQLGYLQ